MVFGTYLPLGLLGMKVKVWRNHLLDEMLYLHRILSSGGVMWIAIPTFSFIDISPCLCGVGRCVGVDG